MSRHNDQPEAGVRIAGIGVSPGVAIAETFLIARTADAPGGGDASRQDEHAFDRALTQAAGQIEQLVGQLRTAGRAEEAEIIETQILMLQDPTFIDPIREAIAAGTAPEQAVIERAEALQRQFSRLDDPYLAARAADVLDIASRLCRNLRGEQASLLVDRPCIVVAHDLSPSQTASLDPALVRGLAIDAGSPTSHTAILARSLGIPAVVGLGRVTEVARAGQEIAIDGEAGVVIVQPSARDRTIYLARARTLAEAGARRERLRDVPGRTRDGRSMTVAANIGSPDDLAAAQAVGAEGVGLFRTEFLFSGRDYAPTEDEQVAVYTRVLEAMGGQTVVIRTLDIGGDKPLPYLPHAPEANPFLGVRGIRYTLAQPELLRVQLRALLRSSNHGRLAIMFPMVSELMQLEQTMHLVQDIQAEVGGEAEMGIMIEVPAAALMADHWGREVSFLSVGTNDLVQYTLAVDRVNEQVASLYQPLHPAVLRLLAQTVRGIHANGGWAGICGEMAGDPLALPILVGLGFDELSMAPGRILAVKERLQSLSSTECEQIATEALECASATAVENLLRERVPIGGKQ